MHFVFTKIKQQLKVGGGDGFWSRPIGYVKQEVWEKRKQRYFQGHKKERESETELVFSNT